MLKLLGSKNSRAFRVLWMLEELGLDYTFEAAAPRSDAVRALNPTGKIPVLVADGEVLTDSVAIMTYLADREGRLTYPAGTPARARQDAFTQRVHDDFDAPLWTAARHSFILPEEHRVPAIKPSLRWEVARHAAQLAGEVEGPFLMGEEMTVPDLVMAHCLSWAKVAKFDLGVPFWEEYGARMQSRPAYARARDRRGA